MRVGQARLVDHGRDVRIVASVEQGGHKQDLWYSVGREHAQWLTTERLDAFLVALLPLAMKNGEDICVEGAVSEKLYYNLTNYSMRILTLIMPALRPVRVMPESLDRGRLLRTEGCVVTGFSGGIDSFCVLADHFYGDVPEGYKITHLVFNNVGSAGAGGRSLFEDRYAGLLPFTKELGIPFIKVDSNLDEVLNMSFPRTHTMRNVSAILTMQKLFAKYLYASGVSYCDCFVDGAPDMAYTDPIMAPLLSSEITECIPTGAQYSRAEKTERVAVIALSHEYLNVCTSTSPGGNCSACYKCLRTQLTLEVLGKLHLYSKVFDLSRYHEVRSSYIDQVLSSTNHFDREIANLARKRGHRFPLAPRVVSWLRLKPIWRLLPAFVRKAARGALPYRWRL